MTAPKWTIPTDEEFVTWTKQEHLPNGEIAAIKMYMEWLRDRINLNENKASEKASEPIKPALFTMPTYEEFEKLFFEFYNSEFDCNLGPRMTAFYTKLMDRMKPVIIAPLSDAELKTTAIKYSNDTFGDVPSEHFIKIWRAAEARIPIFTPLSDEEIKNAYGDVKNGSHLSGLDYRSWYRGVRFAEARILKESK